MEESWLEEFRLHFGLKRGTVKIATEEVIQIDASLSKVRILQMGQWLTNKRHFGYEVRPANVARAYKER